MYKHRESLTNIIVHDCIAETAFLDGNDLVMDFPEGVWISDTHPENTSGKVLHTDSACIRFENALKHDDILAATFALHILQDARKNGNRKARSLYGHEEILRHLTASHARLELLDLYHEGYGFLLRGIIRYPRNKQGEFFLEMMADGVSCLWNDLSPDWAW